MMNKRGEGYISVCVGVIVLCMMLSVFISFALTVNVLRQCRRNMRVVLDNYVMTDSIAIYNAIKQGDDTLTLVDSARYRTSLSAFCSMKEQDETLYFFDEYGKERFRMTAPELSFTKDYHLKLKVSATVTVPLYFAGIHVTDAKVPITVMSQLNEKF